MSKVYYFSDLLLEDLVGGGELNDYELCKMISSKRVDLIRMRTNEVKKENLNKNSFYIISNFLGLKQEFRSFLSQNCKYLIYEHDHKYLRSRNPAMYKDYKAPADQIVNKEFYKNAKVVFCQSSFHESIIKKNLNIGNIFNISGNLWSIDSLETMRLLSKRQKEDCYSILNSRIEHKNTREAAFYCEKKKHKYTLISSKDYTEFLNLLSSNSKFLFLPKTPETLSRVVVEAMMMNVKVTTNKRVGASYEPWFNKKGEELINLMINKREEILNKVLEIINE